MKAIAILLTILVTSLAPAFAAPFSVRTLPAGFDASGSGFAGGPRKPIQPIAADFLRNGHLQWYQGGNVISRFPEGGTITLPSISLPGNPSATAVPLAAAVCDVDRDGDNDLVRINEWNGSPFKYTLQVFLKSATASFTLGYRLDWTNNLPFDEGEHHLSIVPADYNKDGAVDLAVLETYSYSRQDVDPIRYEGRLYIRWNDGTGGFATSTTLQGNGFTYLSRLSTADYDRDGDADLLCNDHVTFGPEPTIGERERFEKSLLFKNDGTGNFSTGGQFSSRRFDHFIDLNGDGWADLSGVWKGDYPVSGKGVKALNNGSGTFGVTNALIDPPETSQQLNNATFGRIDGNLLPDLVVSEGAEIRYLPNHGGGFQVGSGLLSTLSAEVTGLGVADSDGDGDSDIFASLKDGSFVFLENRELHVFPGAEVVGNLDLVGVTGLQVADFDRDGLEDLLAVTPVQKRMWVMFGQDGEIPGTPNVKLTSGEAPHSAVVADYNLDGFPDVAYTVPATGQVRIASNTGSVSPASWPDASIASGIPGVSLLTCGEYGTANGRPDLFCASSTTGQVRGLYQFGSGWLGQNIGSALSPAPVSLAPAEFTNAPGNELSILTASSTQLQIRTMVLNPGWTNFGSGRTESITNGPHVHKLIWAKINGGGYPDAIFTDGTGQLAIHSPLLGTSIPMAESPSAIRDFVAVDWNRDGRGDVLCATEDGLAIVHFDQGAGQWIFTELAGSASGGGYSSLAVLDFNRDGWPDVAAADISAGRVVFFANKQHYLRADFASSPALVSGTVGSTVTSHDFQLRSAGRTSVQGNLVDPSAVINQVVLEFRLATLGPDGEVPGRTLNAFEIQQLVTSASLTSGGQTFISKPSTEAVDGFIYLDALPENAISAIEAGTSVDHQIRMVLSPTAVPPGALSKRFFVILKNIYSQPLLGGNLSPGFGLTTILEEGSPVLIIAKPDYTPLEAWRASWFGNPDPVGSGANDVDYDLDGTPNLVEYVLGTNPILSNGIESLRSLRVLPIAGSGQAARLRLILSNSAMDDPKIRVTIQWATGLSGWSSFSSRTGGGTWSNGVIPATFNSDAGTTTTHVFTTGFVPATNQKVQFRLLVEELP